jgi:hypothetical protein
MPTGMNQAHTQDWGAVNVGSSSRPNTKIKTGVAKRYGTLRCVGCECCIEMIVSEENVVDVEDNLRCSYC